MDNAHILISGHQTFNCPITVNFDIASINRDESKVEVGARGRTKADYLFVKESLPEAFYDHSSDAKYYRIKHYPKGRVLLVNNQFFRSMTEEPSGESQPAPKTRTGSLKDLHDMINLWEEIGCVVTSARDLTVENLSKVVEHFAHAEGDADFYVIMIMSHGRQDDFVVGSQAGELAVKKLIQEIAMSDQMEDKPKLIFFQMCRGKKIRTQVDTGGFCDDIDDVNDDDWIQKMLKVLHPRPRNADSNSIQTDEPAQQHLQATKDVMLAFGTQPDEVSYRDPIYGSWFIQSIKKVFSDHAATCDVIQLMEMVKTDLKRREVNEPESKYYRGRMAMDFADTFQEKTLKLFPGFPRPNKE